MDKSPALPSRDSAMHSGGDPAAAAAAAQSAAQRRQRHWTMASESGALAVRTSTGDFFSHARPGLAGGGGQHFSFTPRAHFICGDERGGGATAPMCRHGPARRGQHAPDGGDHGPFAHGGLGHSGDASLIFEDLRLPHPPMRGPERYVVRQLLSRSVDLGLGDVLASRAEQLLRVHEVSARGLEAGREVRKVAVVQAALLGVGVGLAQAVIEDLVGGPALAVVLGWVGGNAEGTGAAAAVQVELDGTFWLHLCILLGSLLLTVAVEMLLLLKIVLHAASKQISLLGVDLSASMASRSKQATTAATMGGEQQQQPFARAVARAVLGLEDEGCVIKLGVSPRPDTGWYAWLRCRTPGCRERSSAAYWLRLVVFVLFKQVLAKTCLRALVPAVSLPLFAVLNFLLVDAQLKRCWVRLLGLPTALEVVEELLHAGHQAKRQLYCRAADGQLLHRPGWAPHALQRVLAAPHNPYPYLGGGYLTAPWPPPPDGVAQDTARWHTLVSWHITQTLASQPQFEATRRQFEEEGAAPAAAELRELARTLWRAAREGTDADEAAAVEWLQAWLRSKLALREMRAACLALEPEGWDQLRRCLAVLVIETGGWDPTHELMLQYLCQEVGGDLLQPLIPEQSVVPADGEAVSERDVQAILAMQCKLLLEDRQMVVAVLLLLVVVSGEISTQAEGFISQLIRSSKRKFADDDDADDADDDDDDGWPIGQPAGPNGAAGRQPREQGGYRASGVLGAASHFPSPGKHVVPGDDQDSLRYTAVFDDTDEAAAPPDAAGLGARRSAPHTAKLSRQQSLVLHSSIDRIFDKMHSKQAARELFAGFDTDGDGTMNLLEFGRALAAQNLELSEEQLRLLAAEMDHDHDGAIDVEDFLVKLWQRKFARLRRSFRHAASRGRRSHDWARLFHMYDQDSSGQLTFDEFLRAVRHDIKIEAKVVSDAGLREMFDHVDRSGDQHIDLMEFASMVGGTEELENEWTKRINMAEVAQLARDFCNVRRTVTMQDIVHLVSGVAIVDERGAAAAGSSSARARVPQLRMLPRPNLRGGQLVRANLARALDLSHATKAHGSRKQLFELHQNRLHSYNFLILCWAVGVLGVTAGLQVMLEAPALWHLHIFAALAAFQLCAALFGVLAVRRQQISSLKWYFVVHFFEIVLTVVVGVACFVVMGYMETYVQEVWGQDGWLDGMRRVFCAHIADRSGPVCEELVIDRTQTYLLVHGVGECCVCGLLLLSIKSAFSVIQLSELQRIYTLLILSLCANLLLGVCSLGWSVYKVALWPNDASADARLGSSVFDLAILGRSLLTLLQFLLGVRGAIAKWQGGMRAHQLLVLLQLGLAFYLVAVGAMDIDSWTVGNTPAYVADSHFGYAPCSALCAEVMTLQGVNGADFVPTNRSQNLPLGLTYLHNESCAPQTLAELQQRWRDCDARCLAEGGDLCEPMAYRTCSAAAAAAAAAREGEDAAAAAAAAAPPDEFATMLNCTCPAHVDCVLSLKVGFMNQIYAALVLAVIMLVLLALELWAGGQLLSHWDVFAHEHQAKKPQQKWKHKASIRTKRRAAAP